MREILFRGKRIGDGKWFEGYYCGGTENKTISPCIFEYLGGMKGYDYHNIILDTLGQYTGMKDIHGVKIFEGDVLKMEIKSNYINPLQAPLVFIGVCKFKDGAFGFSKQRAGIEEFTAFSSTTYNVEFEIIGNIHDNADLLGENNAK